jgi:hypothetical protein
MGSVTRLAAHEVSELFVLQKTSFFVDTQLWPSRQILDPLGWLSNFDDDERPYAVHLLNVFMFFSESMCDAMLRATVQSLSADLAARAVSLAEAESRWREFLSTVVVSYVHGERPNASDSGHLFARKARQVLGIAEHQILEPAEAISVLLSRRNGVLLLVDDFVGSGRQMLSTWNRSYASRDGKKGNLRTLAERGTRIVYVPLIATSYGLSELRATCLGLEVRAAHELDPRYSLTHPTSILWPDSLRSRGINFILTASTRAGILDVGAHWQGFHDLALGVGFWHGVPDATLPLFLWDRNDWKPLLRRA